MTTLRSKVLAGLAWSGGTRLLGQVITWAITLIVYRVLKPQDYGLFAMATVFMALLTLVADVGLGQALVQVENLDDRRVRQVFGAIVVVAVTLFATQFAFAPLIANFFGESRLTMVLRVLAANFLFGIFTSVPAALMARELDFKYRSLIDLGGAILASITTLAMSLNDFGVWALVIGMLVSQAFNSVAYNIARPYLRWPKFSLDGIRALYVFGGQMTLARVLWFIYSQADMFIAGKMLGKEPLGIYSVAMHLASLPVQKVSSVINQVAFPAFARTREDLRLTGAYLIKSVRILSFFSFPLFWGISALAEELIAVVLGAQWSGAAVPLQVLSIVMPIRMISNFVPSATDGAGRADVSVRNLLVSNALLLPAFTFGSLWGLSGLCAAWLTVSPMAFLINLRHSTHALQMKMQEILRAMMAPALSSLLMVGAIAFLRAWSLEESTPWRLVIGSVVGAVVYLGLAWATNRQTCTEILSLRSR